MEPSLLEENVQAIKATKTSYTATVSLIMLAAYARVDGYMEDMHFSGNSGGVFPAVPVGSMAGKICTKEIIKGTETKKTALKLSRLEPEQQKEAAALLAAEKIKTVDEYTAAKAEEPAPDPVKQKNDALEPIQPEKAKQAPKKPALVSAVPYALPEEGIYMSYRKKYYPQKPDNRVPAASPVYENPGDNRSIYTGRLTSCLPYQRPVNPKEVDRLIREWDGRLLDPIVVSFRDGKFSVADGQHRIIALRKMNGKDVMEACKVYSGLTYQQEADLCYKLDKAKQRLSLSQSTNAPAETGTDAEVAEVKRLVESCGFVWVLGKSHSKTGEIVSTRALMNAYRLLGGPAFSRMLSLVWGAWSGNPRSLTAAVLSGMRCSSKPMTRNWTTTPLSSVCRR